jgi:hypothetical protein
MWPGLQFQLRGGGLIKLNWNLLSVLYLQEKREKIHYSKILSKLSPRISSHKQSAGGFLQLCHSIFCPCFYKGSCLKNNRSAARSFGVLQLIKLFVFSEFAGG